MLLSKGSKPLQARDLYLAVPLARPGLRILLFTPIKPTRLHIHQVYPQHNSRESRSASPRDGSDLSHKEGGSMLSLPDTILREAGLRHEAPLAKG